MNKAAELARQYHALLQEEYELKLRKVALTDALAREMGRERLEVEGLGAFEKRYGKKRTKWDHEALYGELAKRTRTATFADPSTGEVYDDFEKAFYVLQRAANPAWRVTALKEFGIQADEYCSSTPGLVTIQFHGKLEEETHDEASDV